AVDGHLLWRTPFAGVVSGGAELFWDGAGTAWFVAFTGDVAALDARTGALRFRKHLGDPHDTTPIRQARAIAGRLVLAGDHDVWCIDAAGVEKWRAPLLSASLESLDGDAVVVQPHMAPLAVLDVASGRARATYAVAFPRELRRVGDYVVDLE